MITKRLATLLAAGALVAGVHQAQAAAITGNISFTTANGSNWTGDGGDINTIESILDFGDVEVNGTSGSFSGIAAGTAVTMGEPLDFVAPTSIVNPFWTVGGFTFDLGVITDVNRNDNTSPVPDTLALAGTGTISDGVDSQIGYWVWSGDMDGTSTFTFSSTTFAAVPDGGATAMLLGLGVLGMATLRRKLS